MIAAWFFASFAGAALAGVLGTFWTRMGHAAFFLMMALVACIAAGLLHWLESRSRGRITQRARLAPANADGP
jgi:POT family proton-dependent oligopeptide transporter